MQRSEEWQDGLRLEQCMAFKGNSGDQKEIEKAKSRLLVEFGSNVETPKNVTIEVLQKMIKEKPEIITSAVRKWLRPM